MGKFIDNCVDKSVCESVGEYLWTNLRATSWNNLRTNICGRIFVDKSVDESVNESVSEYLSTKLWTNVVGNSVGESVSEYL